MVNVEYLKLFKPSMFDEEEDHMLLPIVEDFTPHALEELNEDTIL